MSGNAGESTLCEVLERLRVAEERNRELERENAKLLADKENAGEREAIIAFLRTRNKSLRDEYHALSLRVVELERSIARGSDDVSDLTAEASKKVSIRTASLARYGFCLFSKRYEVEMAYCKEFASAVQSMDEQQRDLIKRAVRSLADHGHRGTPRQNHRKVERTMEDVSVPIGAMMSSASKRLRYFWLLVGEGAEKKLIVYFAEKYK